MLADKWKTQYGSSKIDVMEVNLGSLASIRAFCSEFKRKGLPLHVLLNNAGTFGVRNFRLSEDGIEYQMAVNYVGLFYLTLLLLPVIEKTAQTSPDVRIVNVSSKIHEFMPSPLKLDLVNDPKSYWSFGSYGKSKLAVIQFTRELQRRICEKGIDNVYVNTLDPGFVATSVFYKELSLFSVLAGIASRVLAYSPATGALTQVYASTSPEIIEKQYKGEYFVPIAKLGLATDIARDGVLAKELWEWTERIISERGFSLDL
ncbi:hypothetical protein HDU67_002583 [Dinochytrium kinnereticum]|nr:hypothetical protein HDU67_002583 [Dinochytrium kinnereticum]